MGRGTFVQNVLDIILSVGTPMQNEIARDPEKTEKGAELRT